jgi:hydrogenase maturation protease
MLILGLGNDILTDYEIGPKLVKKLQKDLLQPNIAFQTAAVGGLEILELVKDFGKVIIIDAIKTMNGMPGSVYHMTPENFKETLHISSFHDISFLAAIDLADKMNISIPSHIHILAIEIKEDMIFSNEFSSPIKRKYGHIYEEIMLEAVRKLV